LQPVCKGSFISYFNKTSKAELFFLYANFAHDVDLRDFQMYPH